MLSRGARLLHRATAVAWLAFGATLFVMPAWAAERFPWTVSPFVAMTIGGWCIGVAAGTWLGGGRGPIAAMLPILAFAWAFGLGEVAVLFVERPAVRADALLAIPYVLALVLTLGSGGIGLLELAHRPAAVLHEADSRVRLRASARAGLLCVAVALAALAIASAGSELVGPATSGKVFPEAVTLLTVRAFAALIGSIAVAALVAAVQGSRVALGRLALVSLLLAGTTLSAAVANLDAFDLVNRPLGWLYLGGWAALLVTAGPVAWRLRDVFTPRMTAAVPAPDSAPEAASEPTGAS